MPATSCVVGWMRVANPGQAYDTSGRGPPRTPSSHQRQTNLALLGFGSIRFAPKGAMAWLLPFLQSAKYRYGIWRLITQVPTSYLPICSCTPRPNVVHYTSSVSLGPHLILPPAPTWYLGPGTKSSFTSRQIPMYQPTYVLWCRSGLVV